MTDASNYTIFHISRKGKIEPCSARPWMKGGKPCPLGGVHFEDEADAHEYLEWKYGDGR